MYGSSREDGVSYFLKLSTQCFLALAISEADEIAAPGWTTCEDAHRHWKHFQLLFLRQILIDRPLPICMLLENFIPIFCSTGLLSVSAVLSHTFIHHRCIMLLPLDVFIPFLFTVRNCLLKCNIRIIPWKERGVVSDEVNRPLFLT